MSENYSCREALTVLHAYGFTEERIKKHRILRHPEFNGSVTLPSNPAKPLSPLVLGNIKRLTGMTLQQLTSESQRRPLPGLSALRRKKPGRAVGYEQVRSPTRDSPDATHARWGLAPRVADRIRPLQSALPEGRVRQRPNRSGRHATADAQVPFSDRGEPSTTVPSSVTRSSA